MLNRDQQLSRAMVCGVVAHIALSYLQPQNFIEEGDQASFDFAEALIALKRKALEFLKTISTYEVGLAEKRHTANTVKYLKEYESRISRTKEKEEMGDLVIPLLKCAMMYADSTQTFCESYPLIRVKAQELHKHYKKVLDPYIFPAFPDLEEKGISLFYTVLVDGKATGKQKKKRKR